jgi:hypothetical protein
MPAKPLARPRQYLSDLVMTSGMVGIVVLVMSVVGRLEQVFFDFHLALPWITVAILFVHSIYARLFVWAAIWLIPLVAPLLLGQVNRRLRRWAYFAAFLFVAMIILVVVLAMMIPLTTLLEGVSTPGTK